jgi:RNA polymerase sigma factor (sigma-70 family)
MSPLNLNEKQLLSRIRQGEREAWEELVDNYGRLIYYAIQRTMEMKGLPRNPEDVQDLFQSLFLHLAEDNGRRLLSYTGKHHCSLATWIRMIAINFTIDFIRRQARYSFHVEFEEKTPEEFERSWFEPQPEADSRLDEKSREQKLAELVSELDKQDRDFLKLYLSGMTPGELARLYKTSTTGIYSRYNRLKEKLREAVSEKA